MSPTHTRARKSVTVFATLVLAFSVSSAISESPAQSAALTKPNIVLIMTDDQTMESVAKMAYVSGRTDWITFDNAQVENALCCPDRATMTTGQYDTHSRVTTNVLGHLLNDRETVPVWLSRAGYCSGKFGKYLNGYPFGRGLYKPPGWCDWHAAMGNSLYQQYEWDLNSNGVKRHFGNAPADYQVDVLAARTISFIKAQAAARKPFYAEFTPSATHSPWKASPTRIGTFTGATIKHDPNYNEADVSDKPAYVRALPLVNTAYQDQSRRKEWEAAASVDDSIKRIDAALQTVGVFNNTVVIFMTDNGFSFGAHRWRRKHCQYNECHKTPLLIRYPGRPGRHDTHLVSSVDMASTISQLAGATPAIPQDGQSLVPLLLGTSTSWRESILQHHPGGDMDGRSGQFDSIPQYWSVVAKTSAGLYKYVELDTGERELYNQVADPYELINRVGNPTYAGVQSELKKALDALKSKATAGAAPIPVRSDMPVAGIPGPDYG